MELYGVEEIRRERDRQKAVEGFSTERDLAYRSDELVKAAICYAAPHSMRHTQGSACTPAMWPWHIDWWKPTPDDRIRELAKAGALIAAEIDRINYQRGIDIHNEVDRFDRSYP